MTTRDPDRAAQKAELNRIMFWPRTVGLAFVVAAAIALVWNAKIASAPDPSLTTASYVVLGFGWVLLLVAIFLRSRYHRRRLSGD